ncbi:hypothetical protein EAH75_06060 [Rhodanobacter glycinis]|uniref:Uncharacterized protein n=1 Tax=Rhodanobacter glycinis TaxID=582702 RepID=A0A502CAZ3_9GAMM|nr:hypothetical protein EAH88_07105 [Rhodanobacter glycinis]TPG50960.1 hypothetical protein EAH75_06060 [Rhodanobacter glycinis]
MRASPLPKRYGWGLYFNAEGKVALCTVESPAYKRFAGNPSLMQRFAMRSKRACTCQAMYGKCGAKI